VEAVEHDRSQRICASLNRVHLRTRCSANCKGCC
jgi:hypothetical protein